MEILRSVGELNEKLEGFRNKKKSIGFVPTMGALHNGHLSLINKAATENDLVVVSIFVNPTQFNNPDDLKNYPRDLNADVQLLKQTPCKFVFAPDEREIYPNEASKKSEYDFGHLGNIMEGKYRPGHFNGVATVVKRLFEIVKPGKAYFGQKDIQQFFIVNALNNNYLSHLNIKLIKCPIVRENDGLAMSSRNVLLNTSQRTSATLISKSLYKAKEIYQNYNPDELKVLIISQINIDKNLKVEYLEFVSEPDLKPVESWMQENKILACIAVQVGNVRLIDNMYFN